MKAEAAQQAARLLAEAWQVGVTLPNLPDSCRPGTLAEGYRIQGLMVKALGIAPGGWKIGCTSAAARKILKARGPFAGPVIGTRIFNDGTVLPASGYPTCGLEGEFAFRLGRALPPRKRPYARGEVLAAIDTLHPAIEIIAPRFADWNKVPLACVVADLAADAALILGKPIARWRSLDLAKQPVRMLIDGNVAGEGTGADVMGHPIEALRWLANFLRSRGGLAAGDVVTTGTCTGLQFAKPGSKVRAEFGKNVSVGFELA